MPTSAPRPCKQPGCRSLTYAGAYCADHKRERQKQADATRKTSTQRGYGYRWQKASKGYLKSHLLCACDECKIEIKKQRDTLGLLDIHDDNYYLSIKFPELAANVVDHIKPHGGDMSLFWDSKNWQPMNKRCHDKKTAKEDGGFTGSKQHKGGGQKSIPFYL
ncbi:MAG: hypothetical protein ACSHWN_04655 [Methylophilaceae bacterium]